MRSLVLMMRVISTFRVVNQIFVAGADHLRKGLVAVVGRTFNIIPERDELGRIASECQLFFYS